MVQGTNSRVLNACSLQLYNKAPCLFIDYLAIINVWIKLTKVVMIGETS